MTLKLFTAYYPYGLHESFLNNELPFLEQEFEKVIIYPFSHDEKRQTQFTGNSDVCFDANRNNNNSLRISERLFALKILLIEFFHCKKKRFFLKSFKSQWRSLYQAVLLGNWYLKHEDVGNDVHYSFWMNEWALALAILKKRKKIDQFAFRVNGYDIWDERHPGNYLPFRYFIYSQTENIFSLSKTATSYLKGLNVFPEKALTNYFGTKDHGSIAPSQNEKFTVFSNSSLIPLKRADKIAETLCNLPFPVYWVHHGDGDCIDQVNEVLKAKGQNIEFKHSQRIEDYSEVLELQLNLNPDIFINLSSTEGLPVTLIEAISMGIPILVNDVGSCSELINENTGIMVDKDESPENIAVKIIDIKKKNEHHILKDDIKNFWEQNFSADKNYGIFAKQLKSLGK